MRDCVCRAKWIIDHSLINLNQMRHNGATVQDNPFYPSPLFIEMAEADFFLPLEIPGTNILANTRTPTDGELANCRHIVGQDVCS